MIKSFLQLLLRGYKKGISPLLGRRCRFYPTCSCYAQEALKTHSTFKALSLILKRLLKCGPWHPGGVDFVPGSRDDKLHPHT